MVRPATRVGQGRSHERAAGDKQQTPRMGRPRSDGRPPLTRQEVLDAARSSFARLGIAGTSIRSIAQQLGSHPASVFHHFPTKEHVIAAVATDIFGRQLPHMHAVLAIGAAPDVALYKLVRDDAMFSAGGEGDQRRVFLLPEIRSAQFPQVREMWEAMAENYAGVLRDGIASGVFREVPARVTAEFLCTLPIVSIVSFSSERFGSDREIGRQVARFALRSLLAKPARLEAVEKQALSIHVR